MRASIRPTSVVVKSLPIGRATKTTLGWSAAQVGQGQETHLTRKSLGQVGRQFGRGHDHHTLPFQGKAAGVTRTASSAGLTQATGEEQSSATLRASAPSPSLDREWRSSLTCRRDATMGSILSVTCCETSSVSPSPARSSRSLVRSGSSEKSIQELVDDEFGGGLLGVDRCDVAPVAGDDGPPNEWSCGYCNGSSLATRWSGNFELAVEDQHQAQNGG